MPTVLKQPKYEDLSPRQRRQVDRAVAEGVPKYHAVCIMAATAKYRHISFTLGLALVEGESGFRNVWGGDPPPNGGTSGLRFKKVTKDRYLQYKRVRGPLGRGGMQGVNSTQLTWYQTQDYADRRGGCWKVYVAIDVGCQTLAARIRDFGYVKGCARYNGSGPAADLYSARLRARNKSWKRRI